MTTTRTQRANGIDLAYETFGDPGAPPMLLVMGLGTQMLGWHEDLCRQLADEGFYVVRFDNRDIGLSTHLSDLPAPDFMSVALRRRSPAYRITDFAADTAALIDALALGPVHLVGASMGGFIAQTVAIERPDLVATLTLIMTSTGSLRVGTPLPKVLSAIVRRQPATTRPAAIEATVAMLSLISSPDYPFDEAGIRAIAGQAYDRGYDPDGTLRQLGAVVAQADRTRALSTLDVPTLVIHGLQDPLVRYTGGLAVARAVPRSRFIGFRGMGHNLPRELWPDFVSALLALTKKTSTTR